MFLELDTWMVRLFGDDTRPEAGVINWYLERRERCQGVLWSVALDVARAGPDVFLELGLVSAAERVRAYETVTLHELPLTVRLLDAPREVRRERVARRNEQTGAVVQQVPPELFEFASDAWEPPSASERETWRILDG